jgi:hypothetical protein
MCTRVFALTFANLSQLKMPSSMSPAHGRAFRQTWLGFWRKYSADITLSAHRRTDNALDAEMKRMLNNLDFSLLAAARRIRQLDEGVYNRMRVSHHEIVRKAMKSADDNAQGKKHQAWFAADPDRKRTSSYRNRGLGTMLAVSISTGGRYEYPLRRWGRS